MLTHLKALLGALTNTDTAKVLVYAAKSEDWTDEEAFAEFCDEHPGVEKCAWIGWDLWEADLGYWVGDYDGHCYPTVRLLPAGRALAAMLQTDAAAEIERLQSALDAAPVREERVGECWCRRDMLGKRYFMCGWKLVAAYNNGCALTEPVMQGTTFCPHCGASLDADGTARRWKERDA
jgi:hypothetical protein